MNKKRPSVPRPVLAIDIGGTGLKAALVSFDGKLLSARKRISTPYPCPPPVLLSALVGLVRPLKGYGRIAIGFPGVVRDGRVLTAPHFGTELWHDFALARALSDALGHKPARLINDAEMQGMAAISGSGLELVLTLGTGAGTALFRNGELMPHMELAHHPVHKSKTYNDYVGEDALKRSGKKAWNRRVAKVIVILSSLLNYDRLYIGGGNAHKISLKLPANVTLVTNDAGLEGGGFLWRQSAER
jgi:polyphosphate glucokinase